MTGSFASGTETLSADGVTLAARWWGPPSARAACLYVHGLAAHGGWIEPLATRLASAGLLVMAPDLRGHGRSGPAPGRLSGPGRNLRDLTLYWQRLRERAQNRPAFVMGTSLGGCLAVAFAAVERDVSGAVLISPAFEPIYLSRRETLRMRVDLLRGGFRTWPTPRARGLPICGSQSVREQLARDPLSLDRIDTRSLLQAHRIVRLANRWLGRACAPMLCIQGARDPVISAAKNRALFERPPQREFVTIAEGYHDLGLEPEVGNVDEIVLDWLSRREIA